MAKYRRTILLEAVQYIEGMEDYWVVIDPKLTTVHGAWQRGRVFHFVSKQEALDSHYYDSSCEAIAAINSPPGWYLVKEGDWIVTNEDGNRIVYNNELFNECFELCQP